MRKTLRVFATLAIALACALTACNPFLLARRGADGTILGLFDGLAEVDPAVRQKVHNAYLGDVDFQKSVHDLSQNLVAGLADGLRQAQVDQAAAAAVNAAMTALRQQGGLALTELAASGPELERVMRNAISESILSAGAALQKTASRDLAGAVRVLVAAAVDGTMEALERHLHSPDVRAYAENNLAPAAGLVSRALMREAVLGLREGLDQASKGERPPLRAIMREVGAGLAEGMRDGVNENGRFETLLLIVLAVQGGCLMGLVVGSLILWRRYAQTTKSLTLFARQMSKADEINQEYGQQLRRAITEAHEINQHDTFLSNFLLDRGLVDSKADRKPPAPVSAPKPPPPPE